MIVVSGRRTQRIFEIVSFDMMYSRAMITANVSPHQRFPIFLYSNEEITIEIGTQIT